MKYFLTAIKEIYSYQPTVDESLLLDQLPPFHPKLHQLLVLLLPPGPLPVLQDHHLHLQLLLH